MDIKSITPTVRLWRRITELRDKITKQTKELNVLYKQVEAVKDDEAKIEIAVQQVQDKLTEYKNQNFETKISIVAEVFGVKDTDAMSVVEVAETYRQLESKVMDKMIAKAEEIPNAETLAGDQ